MRYDNNTFRVIAIGGDHYNTYGIVRSLGQQGIKTDVVILSKGKIRSFVLKSKYVANGVVCQSKDEAVNFLISKYDNSTVNIVICCSDEAEELIIEHYGELASTFILPLCNTPQETKRLMNKMQISSFARDCGLVIPKSWEIHGRIIPKDISYPCLTKPIESTLGRKSDIVVCYTYEDLKAVVGDTERCSDFIVQEYIEYEKEISILGAVLQKGEVELSGCIDKLRTCMIGTSSFAVMVENSILEDNLNKIIDLMKRSGYKGLFSIEFLKKNDVFYFLEVNFRNDGNTYVATASGQNLPYKYVMSCLGERQEVSITHYPCYFMLEVEDFKARRKNGVSFRQWRKDLHQADCCLVYAKEDIGPFREKIRLTVASLYFFRIIRGLFRKIGCLKSLL